VFTIPKIPKDRYWSLQLIDLYTFNFEYAGSRTTGNDGGSFMVAAPQWQGEKPPGIAKVTSAALIPRDHGLISQPNWRI
jgi:hypothetical protein